MIDRFRQAVYRAEDQWSATLDRGGLVDFFGSQLQVPVQVRFGSLIDVQTYVVGVCDAARIQVPMIRHRRGGHRAHYSEGVIAIPTDEPWAMRESVVLHEVAHHACVSHFGDHLHGERFTSTMLELVLARFGHEAHLLLRTGYEAAGAPIGVAS